MSAAHMCDLGCMSVYMAAAPDFSWNLDLIATESLTQLVGNIKGMKMMPKGANFSNFVR